MLCPKTALGVCTRESNQVQVPTCHDLGRSPRGEGGSISRARQDPTTASAMRYSFAGQGSRTSKYTTCQVVIRPSFSASVMGFAYLVINVESVWQSGWRYSTKAGDSNAEYPETSTASSGVRYNVCRLAAAGPRGSRGLVSALGYIRARKEEKHT